MSLSDKNIREKEFHNKLQSKPKGRFENIFYKAIINAWDDFFNYLSLNVKNSEVLDYGCGIGPVIEKVIKFNPKKITGIDISDVSISKAKEKFQNLNSKVELLVDNCEKTKFDDNKFDIVYGLGILHHLQTSKCVTEISRILKPKGTLLFIEPLGTNPLINFYRALTPGSRSKDEHPLISKDFEIIRESFNSVNLKYYGFLTLVFFPFYKFPDSSIIFKSLVKLDQFLFKIKLFRLFAWSVLITAKKN
jgi:ubiquinone/menaquinone biosynthesis C-methylase UbiE